ncbi:methyltransferase [Cochleicola gelatinilyticus]|uniref:Methyltransferase n=2 Tax=Cochleicola gelatinilyticus TaxID=1763537 RepID=A0A167J1J7_9FLAO|nr:methyltransferase [Cochleicola gelatinilyticus]
MHSKLKVKDHLVTGEYFELLYNTEREMLVTSPQPKLTELEKYYNSDAYISHTDEDKGLVSFLYQTVKKYALKKKLKLIQNLNGGNGTLLDIGAGTGDFLKVAKNSNWEIDGIEPNKNARRLANEKGIDLLSTFDSLPKKQYDIITLWHVLEHLPDLDATLQKIEHLVRPGGSVIIAVPNFNSYDAKFYKMYWAAFDVPRHLWHFSRNSMKQLFSKNIKYKKSLPMIFDSFYVSLLSEKHKSNSRFSIRAIFIGLWSNILAWRSKEYSSLIYIFRRVE